MLFALKSNTFIALLWRWWNFLAGIVKQSFLTKHTHTHTQKKMKRIRSSNPVHQRDRIPSFNQHVQPRYRHSRSPETLQKSHEKCFNRRLIKQKIRTFVNCASFFEAISSSICLAIWSCLYRTFMGKLVRACGCVVLPHRLCAAQFVLITGGWQLTVCPRAYEIALKSRNTLPTPRPPPRRYPASRQMEWNFTQPVDGGIRKWACDDDTCSKFDGKSSDLDKWNSRVCSTGCCPFAGGVHRITQGPVPEDWIPLNFVKRHRRCCGTGRHSPFFVTSSHEGNAIFNNQCLRAQLLP